MYNVGLVSSLPYNHDIQYINIFAFFIDSFPELLFSPCKKTYSSWMFERNAGALHFFYFGIQLRTIYMYLWQVILILIDIFHHLYKS